MISKSSLARRATALLGGIALLKGALAPANLAAQSASSDPWLARTPSVAFESRRAVDAPVQIDVPKKDWMVLPTGESVLVVLASRLGDAVVLVERSALLQTLEPSQITDLFVQLEVDAIKVRHPKAADFKTRLLDVGDRRFIAVEYARPGVLGSERVRQYSLPIGKSLYRVTCISLASKFALYDPVFSHIAGSFSVTEQ